MSGLFQQQLRWRRSIVRDFFFTLKTLPQHVWKLHPNAVLTLDRRDFRAVRPLTPHKAFRLLPDDV